MLGGALFFAEAQAEERDGDEIESNEREIEGTKPLSCGDKGKSGKGFRQTCLRGALGVVGGPGCAEAPCRL